MKPERHLLALPDGYRLGKYVIRGVLGSGGFGITYLAEDTSLRRRVAIKELLPGDFATRVGEAAVAPKGRESDRENLEWARARFIEEGQVLAACTHPNVVEVYEAFAANGTAYLVTRYEEGQDLESWLRGLGRVPTEAELYAILWPLLSGLERVHQVGFLHRDLKPENIYLTQGGRPVLLDFGSARQAIGSRSRILTAVITAGYAPFEQYHEGGQQGPWTDIYALGAVMHRAITGKKPPEAAARMMGNDPYQSLATSQASRYGAGFLRGLDRALRVKASERPQSIAQWRALLGELGPNPSRKKTKRLPAIALAVALMAGSGAIWIAVHNDRQQTVTLVAPTSTPTPTPMMVSTAMATPTPMMVSTPMATSTPIEISTPTAISTPSATPIPIAISTPMATPDLLSEASIESFVQNHLKSVESRQLSTYMSAYDDYVTWYGAGRVSANKIRQEMISYLDRWDKITYHTIGPVAIQTVPGFRGVRVSYPIELEVSSQTTRLRSRRVGTEVVEIKIVNGAPKIVSENQLWE